MSKHESEAARATTGRSVLSGGLWYVASYSVPQGYTLIISIVAARFLGPHGMGRQSFIAFVSITTTTVLAGSMYAAVMRHIGETAGRDRTELLPGLLWWAWRIEGAAALLGGGTLAAAAALGAWPQGAWAFAGVVTAAGILHSVPTAVLIGLQQFRRAAVVGLTTGLAGTVAVTLVLWQGGGITGMFATEAVVGVLNLLWTGTLARRTLASVERGATEEAAPAALRDLRRRVGNYALLSSVALFLELIVGTRSEFFFLNHYSGNEQIAFYSIAFSTVAGLRLIPKALGSSIAPAFATLFGAGSSERIRSGYSRSLRLLLLLTLPLTAAGLALGPELIEEVYGRNYAGAGTPVRILLLAFPVIALSSLATSLLAGFGQLRQPIYANAIAATVDITLAATLIPSLDANGAAIANAAAQAISGALLLFFAARFVRPVDWRPTLVLRIAAVSAGVGLAGWGLVNWVDGFPGVALGAVASIAVFAVLASALGIVADEDATWAEQALGERIGRLVRVCAAG